MLPLAAVRNSGHGTRLPDWLAQLPSLCAVCMCRSPRYQRLPTASGAAAKLSSSCFELNRTSARNSACSDGRMLGTEMSSFHSPGGNRTGKIGGSRVRFADGEVAFVSSAVAAKSLRIGDAEIQRGLVILAGVTEVHADAMYAGRDCKWNFEIRLVLRPVTLP